MPYYFESPENLKRLGDTLESWLGTPYRHFSGVKGLGCDCIHFVARVLEELGYRKRFAIPAYPHDWHLHNDAERLLEGVAGQLKFDFVASPPKGGDLALLKFGRAVAHAGLVLNGKLYHAVNGLGVIATPFTDGMWQRRVKKIMRLK